MKTLKPDLLDRMWPNASSTIGRLGRLMELVIHRQHVIRVLVCGTPASETVEAALSVLPKTATITLGLDGERELHLSKDMTTRTTFRVMPDSPGDWVQATDGPHDLVLVDYSDHQPTGLSEALVSLVKNGGGLLGLSEQFSTLPCDSLHLGQHFTLFKTETYANGVAPENENINIPSLHGSQSLRSAVAASSFANTVREKSIEHLSPEQDFRVVIDNTTGAMFSAICSDAGLFKALQTVLISGVRTLWLTQGVKQGRSASAGMAEGLLRTIHSEQAAARIVLLDIDQGATPEDIGSAIISKLETASTKASGLDNEFWLHNGVLHISCVYPHTGLNQDKSQAQH